MLDDDFPSFEDEYKSTSFEGEDDEDFDDEESFDDEEDFDDDED